MNAMPRDHQKMLDTCRSQGLINESNELTDAGHDYVRALMARIEHHRRTSDGKKDQYLRRA
ncbi:hypothetical protein CWO91_16735 [Bradyrhizobium genosp. SA-3]|uniref:hypothetical protein n=1 Tax=Bradyrhizobium genosp. SA-3 TaxID=508868 RepID=UPI00102A8467|nr:hypothetical protein [Bradyrhizobium genosp. SA-3]RZN09674.1 hypothetical protein CWO91_16735 [Bradyrhizobium genosp. SA-3]